jgi:hypothetical protein
MKSMFQSFLAFQNLQTIHKTLSILPIRSGNLPELTKPLNKPHSPKPPKNISSRPNIQEALVANIPKALNPIVAQSLQSVVFKRKKRNDHKRVKRRLNRLLPRLANMYRI